MEPPIQARTTINKYLPSHLIDLFCQGLNEFNLGEYFECHETLEAVWQEQSGAEREMTQGIIQIAVGLYHLGRQNEVGALKLLDRGATRLEKFADEQIGLTISALAQSVRALLEQIRTKNVPPNERQSSFQIAFC